MADLTEDVKVYIIERLAMWDTPTAILEKLSQEGVKGVTLNQICAYKPGSFGWKRVSPEHKKLFEREQAKFLKDRSAIAITHPLYRLKKLQDILDGAVVGSKTILAVMELYEKIEGGMFTPRVNGASPAEVAGYIREKLAPVRLAIEDHVKDPEVKKRVLDQVNKAERVEGAG